MNKKTKSFWLYTIILFTVALVLVLLSLAMTDYKKANESYESKVQSLQADNAALYEEKQQNEVTINALEEKNRQLTENLNKIMENDEKYAAAVESIYIADGYYADGEYDKAKEELDKVDETILKEKIHERYVYVKEKIEAKIN